MNESGPRLPVPPGIEDVARAAVGETFGPGVRVLGMRTIHASSVSTVLVVRLAEAERSCVLKLVRGEERPATDLGRTAAVLARAGAAGVPVPRVLGVDAGARLGGWQYLVQEHVAGVPWRRARSQLGAAELDQAHAAIARAVAALQSVRISGYGELTGAGTADAGDDLVAALRRRARLRTPAGPALHAAETLLDRTADLLVGSPPPVLTHDDLHDGNLVFARTDRGARLRGVLDWDKAWAGPAEADLARLAFWDGMTGPGFWPVYRELVGARPGEGERLPVHQLLWCLEYPGASARHREDTRRLCRRFGIRPPHG